MSLFDIFRRKKRTATPDPNAERGDWMKWFLNREGLAGKFNADPGGYTDYTPWISFNDGGMVDENQRKRQWETPLARIENPGSNVLDNYYGWNSSMGRDLRKDPSLPHQFQYRETDTLGNQGRTVVSDTEPRWTGFGVPYRAGPPTGVPMTPEWQWPENQGIMGLEMADASDYMDRIQEGYKKIEPYLPDVDLEDKKIGHEWNTPLWGGTLGIEGEYDIDDDQYKAGINWVI